jgi:methyltransferase (TIGR00027 family)
LIAVAKKYVASTAFGAATMKGFERAVRPAQRLFDDPLGPRLLPPLARAFVSLAMLRVPARWLVERTSPGAVGGLACRTRAIDDACRDAVEAGCTQVVILGAGLDTRPYRLPALAGVDVWELDLPAVQEAKVASLTRALGHRPARVHYVPVDFEQTSAGGALAQAGFDAGLRTLVIWEGVSMYLPMAAVEQIFAFAGSLAPGSRLVFTYVTLATLTGDRSGWFARRFRWLSGFDPASLPQHLAPHRLTVMDDVGGIEYQARYLRPLGRKLPVFDVERVAIASVHTPQSTVA